MRHEYGTQSEASKGAHTLKLSISIYTCVQVAIVLPPLKDMSYVSGGAGFFLQISFFGRLFIPHPGAKLIKRYLILIATLM